VGGKLDLFDLMEMLAYYLFYLRMGSGPLERIVHGLKAAGKSPASVDLDRT